MKTNKVGLYKNNETGTMLSHASGLSEEQIEFLQSLKPGDRLVLWVNSYKTAENKVPTHNLCKFKPKKD